MKPEIVTILDNLRSRENVGSIFRTSDAAGVSKIYLCGITPQPPHEKISKTALGAELDIPWEYHKQTWRLVDSLKKEGFIILALEKTHLPNEVWGTFKGGEKVALIVGNEVDGLSPQVLKRSHEVMSIPMVGKKESLNVSVAFGIAIYRILFK